MSSLVLDFVLRGVAKEVASLIVVFRLWRLLGLVHGVAEAMEANHEAELEQHHRLVHGLQQVGGRGGVCVCVVFRGGRGEGVQGGAALGQMVSDGRGGRRLSPQLMRICMHA